MAKSGILYVFTDVLELYDYVIRGGSNKGISYKSSVPGVLDLSWGLQPLSDASEKINNSYITM